MLKWNFYLKFKLLLIKPLYYLIIICNIILIKHFFERNFLFEHVRCSVITTWYIVCKILLTIRFVKTKFPYPHISFYKYVIPDHGIRYQLTDVVHINLGVLYPVLSSFCYGGFLALDQGGDVRSQLLVWRHLNLVW